ncbi:hypothetical protein [Agrobacterium sp. NPDC089420]
MQPSIRYPEPENFISALGNPFDSEAVSKVVTPFGITWSNAVQLDK